jgi:hypothetical protein
MGKHMTDPQSLEAIWELASELDSEADALEKTEQCSDSSTPD